MSHPFDELTGNPIWEEFCRQDDRDPDRINLTDLWRASGRDWLSPRRFWRQYHERHEIEFAGPRPDDSAFADQGTAFHYIQLLDPEIMRVSGEAFFAACRANPSGMLLSACDHSDGAASIAASFISTFNAVDGSRTEGDARILDAVVEKTSGLDTYAQETAVAKVQRALGKAKEIRSGRVIDGEFVEDK
jgi:hypothetical protein